VLILKPVANLSTFEIEQLIARAEVGDTLGGLRYSKALRFHELAKSLGRKTRLLVQDHEAGTHEVAFVETPNETLRRLHRLQPLG
jgi:hypothetical protein